VLLTSGLLLACESTTGPDVGDWSFEPLPQQSLISSDVAKTVLMRDGTLYSWGEGRFGTLGQGNLKSYGRPRKVRGLERVIHFAQNGGMAFALTEDGSLYQWGQYMASSVYPHPTKRPAKAARVVGGIAVFPVGWRAYVVDEGGSLWSVEPSHVRPAQTPAPQQISLPKRVRQVSGALGLFEDGTLFSIGDWGPGPGGPAEGFSGIVAITNSFESTVALRADGTVWAWGRELDAGLGDGIHTESAVPIQLPGLSDVRRISGSYRFRFAVKEDGTVWYWGYRGRDANGDPVYQTVPAQVPGIADAVDVAAHWEALIQTLGGDLYTFNTETLELREVPFP
jgi:hypothetical protein